MLHPREGHRLSRWHDRIALFLGLFVILAALPLASNRATWWLLWTALLAIVATLHLIRTMLASSTYRHRFLDHKGLFLLGLIVPLWALLQSLPVADALPRGLIAMAPGLEALSGSAISVAPEIAASGILRVIGYLLLAAMVLEVASRRDRVLRLGYLLFGGVCLQAIWALVALKLLDDFSPWGPKLAYLGSATGTFINRNSLATFLGFGLVLGVGLIAERGNRAAIRNTRKGRWLSGIGAGDITLLVGMIFVLFALVLTQSRLGLASALAGCLLTHALVRRDAGAPIVRILLEWCIGLTVFVVALGLSLAGSGVADRILFLGTESVNRMAIYRNTLAMIETRPLTGFGMDAFGQAFEAFRTPPLLDPVTYDLAHNSYLMLWAEFGLIFGSAPILALAGTGFALWRKRRSEGGLPGVAAAGLGALAIGTLHSAGDFSLEIPANVYLFVSILALGLGRAMPQSRHTERPRTAQLSAIASKVFG